jgi:hypothetical protein
MRTGDQLGKQNLWMVYLGQVLNGFGASIMTVCTFPEMVDCVERRDDYQMYDREKL